MIPVIGGPAQCQLGKVAGADNKAVHIVGDVHQHLGALACLRVLVNHILFGFAVVNVPQMYPHRLGNVDGVKGDPQRAAQQLGI